MTGVVGFFTLFAVLLGLRLFTLQILQHGFYTALADNQHQLFQQLQPTRGQILVKDTTASSGYYPLATNETLHLLYAVPKQITAPATVASQLQPLVSMAPDELLSRLSKPNDLYGRIRRP